MKNLILILVIFSSSVMLCRGQKKLSDLTLVYEAKVTTGNAEPRMADAFDGATTTIFLKGNMSRSEMSSALFSSTTIHDAQTGIAVVLREVSGQKLLIRMTAANWKDKNARYQGISFTNTSETREIAGYKCTKAVAKMSDGSSFTVFYTPDIIPENKEYDYHFRNLNGLPLEYELTQRNLTIRYTVSKINMNPVPASKFEIPTSGYREMTYDESKKIK
jgi:GLPGLI family protein